MARLLDGLDCKKENDLKVFRHSISIFCREKHPGQTKGVFPVKDERLRYVLGDRELVLCADCTRPLDHGKAKLLLCLHGPRPTCKKCETHCCASGYRERMREAVRFSVQYVLRHGRLDLMIHYFL